MNRKEVIRLLIEEIQDMRGVYDDQYVYPDDYIIAERVLSVVENSGYCNLPWSGSDEEET